MATKGETGEKAKNIFGNKLYQQRARLAFPILVRQARARQPVRYRLLAEEMGLPFTLNLNFVLGSIGKTIKELAAAKYEEIPPLTALVVKEKSGMPGTGVAPFLDAAKFNKLLPQEKREALRAIFQEIYNYPDWEKLLAELDLAQSKPTIEQNPNYFGSGESDAHLALKQYLAQHPKLLGIKGKPEASFEYVLRSGDRLDLLFATATELVAVEVKAAAAPEGEIERGMFQAVKYQALLEAMDLFSNQKRSVRVILALGGCCPKPLFAVRNTLNVECIDNLGQPANRFP